MVLVFENIRKSATRDSRQSLILEDVSLAIPTGALFGIVGPSGAGKSTLLRCANLLTEPDSGRVWFQGNVLSTQHSASLRQARKQIGIVFQQSALMMTQTVRDNIALSLKLCGERQPFIEKRVQALLQQVQLPASIAQRYPAGLSGGEKQRVALARALASSPSLLLCDEATSALDPERTQAILNLLKSLSRTLGITILLVTHEMDVVKQICTQVAFMAEGKVLETGTTEAIFTNPQSQLARQFVNCVQHLPIPERYAKRHKLCPFPGAHFLLSLNFLGSLVHQPILSKLSQQFQIQFNVLNARMENLGETPFGTLLTEVRGPLTDCEALITTLTQIGITVKRIGYV